MNSLAKKLLVVAGATVLAVSVAAQVRDRATAARLGNVVVSNFGGSGGVIIGPAPTSLSPVVVAVPVPFAPPGGGGPNGPSAGLDN